MGRVVQQLQPPKGVLELTFLAALRRLPVNRLVQEESGVIRIMDTNTHTDSHLQQSDANINYIAANRFSRDNVHSNTNSNTSVVTDRLALSSSYSVSIPHSNSIAANRSSQDNAYPNTNDFTHRPAPWSFYSVGIPPTLTSTAMSLENGASQQPACLKGLLNACYNLTRDRLAPVHCQSRRSNRSSQNTSIANHTPPPPSSLESFGDLSKQHDQVMSERRELEKEERRLDRRIQDLEHQMFCKLSASAS
ncbi:hypothetical protein K4K59_004186 [Colletotrichum sp. SAR11_240]|nr:hypothetical protein K4K59_004186 [Colletotrichum sp. SAR11_240]